MADRPVRQLRLLGRTRDGRALVMEAAGERFVLPVDEAVLAAMGAPAPEPEVRANLSPREIQHRVRRGASPAALAVESGADLAAVERYAGPVLDERRHHAEQAAGVALRGRTLRERVAEHPQPPGDGATGPPAWDAWLTDEPGTWCVQVVWAAGDRGRWRWRPAVRVLEPLDAVARAVTAGDAAVDDLEAVLRPLHTRAAAVDPAPPAPDGDGEPAGAGDDAVPVAAPSAPRPLRARRAEVPSWADILGGTGRDPGR